jgi:hypothetical protein
MSTKAHLPLSPSSTPVARKGHEPVGRALTAALSPEVDDAKAANLAIKLISEADPRSEATLEVRADLAVEACGA